MPSASSMGGGDAGAGASGGIPSRIRAFIYDFDDTIVESERINAKLFGRLLGQSYGVVLSAAETDYLYGLSWTGVFDWLRTARGLRPTRAEVWERFLQVKAELLSRQTLHTARGLSRMLALPVPHVIVSGSTLPELRLVMENIGLAERHFRFIISDEDCARGKPDPEGFQEALRRLALPAAEVLVFEDSVPGLQAARAAGIPAAFVAEFASGRGASIAEISFPTLEDAWAAVKGRIGEGAM